MFRLTPIQKADLSAFCHRWKIAEFSFFGSFVRSDFHPGSDVDVLVTFTPDSDWSLWDHVSMEQELSQIMGRKVDLVTRDAVERSPNMIRRKAILESVQPYYVA